MQGTSVHKLSSLHDSGKDNNACVYAEMMAAFIFIIQCGACGNRNKILLKVSVCKPNFSQIVCRGTLYREGNGSYEVNKIF